MNIPEKISVIDLGKALAYMQTLEIPDPDNNNKPYPTKFPYDILPGHNEFGDSLSLTTREAWEGYHWNPPQYTRYTESQDDVMAKPGWKTVVEYAVMARRERGIKQLRQVCREKITAEAFEQPSLDDEKLLRINALERGDDISEHLDKMAAIKARYRKLKAVVNSMTNLEALAKLDFKDSRRW